MQQAICKLKMAKCNWNVIKLDNSCNVWGWKMTRFLLVKGQPLFKEIYERFSQLKKSYKSSLGLKNISCFGND